MLFLEVLPTKIMVLHELTLINSELETIGALPSQTTNFHIFATVFGQDLG